MQSIVSKASVLDFAGQPVSPGPPPDNQARLYYDSSSNSVTFLDSSGNNLLANLYIVDAAGNRIQQTTVDLTTVNNPAPPAGTLVFLRRTWFNDSTDGMHITNTLLGVSHTLGHGGQNSNGIADERAITASMDNSDPAHQDIRQATTHYSEAILKFAPTFHGHGAGEVDWGVYRGSLSDMRTGGNSPTTVAVFSAGLDRSNAGAFASRWVAYYANIGSPAGGTMPSSNAFYDFLAESSGNSGGYTGVNSFYAAFCTGLPTSRFPINYGLLINSFGTNNADFNIYSVGTMSTSSGKNKFDGPVLLATRTPSSASDTGVKGTITWDTDFIYICTATNTWKRASISAW